MAEDTSYVKLKDPVKKCFLPQCPNDNIKKPEMVFVVLRSELKLKWCQMVKRNCPKRVLYCCEDHLNFEEDLENYQLWTSGAKPMLSLTATLKNLPNEMKRENQPKQKKIQQGHIASVTDNIQTPLIQPIEVSEQYAPSTTSNKPLTYDAEVQCSVEYKHKGTTAKPESKDQGTNYRTKLSKIKVLPSLTSETESEDIVTQSPSMYGTSMESASSTLLPEEHHGRKHMMKMIANKPQMYLGLPKRYWWVIDYLAQQYSCPALHIIVTMFKIRNNDSFERMSEEFEIARSTIRRLFEKNIPVLATYFQNFIYLPSAIEIKKNLPLVFKIRYSNVQCIIDCFEIQIEKPCDPLRQSQTWSQYKSCNTMKYLIGCTPAGLICFISNGFGGRMSDKAITEKSGFVDILPLNATIMADRGFKEVEALLSTKNIKMLRPPSVFNHQKMTKREVLETKVIASLRVHVERVIRKIREFHILKPHSVVNHKHVKYLDQIVTIACGLCNMQEPIIKEY